MMFLLTCDKKLTKSRFRECYIQYSVIFVNENENWHNLKNKFVNENFNAKIIKTISETETMCAYRKHNSSCTQGRTLAMTH